MARIVVRAEARSDLATIYAYSVELYGTGMARDYLSGMERALGRLEEFPELGPAYPGIRPPIRFLAHRQHHIFYDYNGQTVCIVRILHHALDAGRLL